MMKAPNDIFVLKSHHVIGCLQCRSQRSFSAFIMPNHLLYKFPYFSLFFILWFNCYEICSKYSDMISPTTYQIYIIYTIVTIHTKPRTSTERDEIFSLCSVPPLRSKVCCNSFSALKNAASIAKVEALACPTPPAPNRYQHEAGNVQCSSHSTTHGDIAL